MSDIGKSIWLSASAVQLWTECQRKWGFRYLEKIELPIHPSAALGTDVHLQVGAYLVEGKPIEFTYSDGKTRTSGEIAAQFLPLLPPPLTPGLRNEREFHIPSPSGGFGYVGFIDLWAPDSEIVPGLEGGRPLLGDFKTTSNLAYAKTSEILKTDIQAQLYAMALMFEDNVDELDLVWFTARTRRPHRAQRAHLRVTASHVAEQFARIDAIGREVAAIRLAKPNVNDLPPNPRMCDAYGGCPHRYRCNLSPLVHAEAVNKEALQVSQPGTNNFLATLRKSVAPTVAIPPAPVAPTVAPAVVVPEQLPAWATAPVDPLHAKAAVNPPESASPVTNTATSPDTMVVVPNEAPKRRGRPPKVTVAAPNGPASVDPMEGFPRIEAVAFFRALATWLEGGAS